MTLEFRRLEQATMTPAQMDALAAVLMGAPGYCMAVQGRPPSPDDAQALITDLPPGYSARDKYVYGIYRSGFMIGCADVLRGWKHEKQSMIGLLLFSEAFQGCGYGTLAYRRIEELIRSWDGMESIRVGVIESNMPALAFWRKMGFLQTGEQLRSDRYSGATIILEKQLC